mgnify:CR=1 FL=1
MTKGEVFTIEYEVGGAYWEVDVAFTGKELIKPGKPKRLQFINLATDKLYNQFTRKAFEALIITPSEWSMVDDDEEVEW